VSALLVCGCVKSPGETGDPAIACASSSLGWAEAPAGTFTMGSPEDEVGRRGDETPHEVTLTRSFQISSHEVPQGVFEACSGYNPSTFRTSGPEFPVEQVSWHEAVAFANALSTAEDLERCYACTGDGEGVSCEAAVSPPYDCVGYRLPTEAEWEYAARAGITSAFPNGGNLDVENASGCEADVELDNGSFLGDIAWFCGNSANTSHPVAQLQANAWGLYDVSGNVWEWVEDAYDLLTLEPVADPYISVGTYRVDRGGSWYDGMPPLLRTAIRGGSLPEARSAGLGFRVVRGK
jgi:formylglycine-generating enzyme required for sulfatase activity